MSCQPRIEFAGACSHVINWGNYRANVFKSDGAKQALLKARGETAEKLDGKIHASVIMANPLLVGTRNASGGFGRRDEAPAGNLCPHFNRLRKQR